MKKIIAGFAISIALLAPSASMAAGLTTPQIDAIMSVLAAFGVDQATLNSVYLDLTATSTPLGIPSNQQSTSTPSFPVIPTFQAATSTVIAPASNPACNNNCVSYGTPFSIPSSSGVSSAPVAPSLIRACAIMFKGNPVAPGNFVSTTTSDYSSTCVNWDNAADARQNGYYYAQPSTGELWQYILTGATPPTI